MGSEKKKVITAPLDLTDEDCVRPDLTAVDLFQSPIDFAQKTKIPRTTSAGMGSSPLYKRRHLLTTLANPPHASAGMGSSPLYRRVTKEMNPPHTSAGMGSSPFYKQSDGGDESPARQCGDGFKSFLYR